MGSPPGVGPGSGGRRRAWLGVGLVAVGLLVAAVVPPVGLGDATGPVGLDRWLHAVGHAALATALLSALHGRGRSVAAVVGLVLVTTAAYGVVLEWLQVGVAGRSADPVDALAGVAGALVVLAAWRVVVWRRDRAAGGTA